MARMPRIGSLAGIVVAAAAAGIPDRGVVRGAPAAAAARPVRDYHHRPQRTRHLEVHHQPQPLRGGQQRLVRGRGRPDPAHVAAAFVPRGQRDALFIGKGTDIAFIDFSQLKSQAITVNANRTSVTVTLPKAQLEPAVLNISQSYVYAQQQGLFNRIEELLLRQPEQPAAGLHPGPRQKIQTAAKQSPLLMAEAKKNTEGMLDGMLTSSRLPARGRHLRQLPQPAKASHLR